MATRSRDRGSHVPQSRRSKRKFAVLKLANYKVLQCNCNHMSLSFTPLIMHEALKVFLAKDWL